MKLFKFVLFFLLCRVDFANSIIGGDSASLEEYYNFGKKQTGVASVSIKKEKRIALGTANLIDVSDIRGISESDLKKLQGRVLVTAAHVISGGEPGESFVKFMTEENESQSVKIDSFYVHDKYHNSLNVDIGLIVLDSAVDTNKFKPLKLNTSTENKSLSGKETCVFGCSPLFGRVNSDFILRETDPMRRGMKTVLDEGTNEVGELDAVFYESKGMISIFRDYVWGFTENDKEKKSIVRNPLSKQFFYEEDIKDQLEKLEDAEDLDKEKLLLEWDSFIKSPDCEYKSMDLGVYKVKFNGPSPDSNGVTCNGDSGGAWVIDGKIVGVTKNKMNFHKALPDVKKLDDLTPSIGISDYFSECEKILPKSVSKKTTSEVYTATSVWSCMNWITSTIEDIAWLLE